MTFTEPETHPWLEILRPQVHTGRTRYALFDFDGTLSVIRRGWERIMSSLMVEMISDGNSIPLGVESMVEDYIDRSTGILTIKQMKWLEDIVRRYGRSRNLKTAAEYKKIYNERLLKSVRMRIQNMGGGLDGRDALMIAGARPFLQGLARRGVHLFLASGTDHEYVLEEAAALGIEDFFEGHIYGAHGNSEEDSKELVIARILEENQLQGKELLVVGDGPVEICFARQVGAVALGVAADEDTRETLSPRKRARLVAACADLLVSNFLHANELVDLFCGRF
jgi:phosphoglycolate phosphatase-like HAD superfamily hydrolase